MKRSFTLNCQHGQILFLQACGSEDTSIRRSNLFYVLRENGSGEVVTVLAMKGRSMAELKDSFLAVSPCVLQSRASAEI